MLFSFPIYYVFWYLDMNDNDIDSRIIIDNDKESRMIIDNNVDENIFWLLL